MYGEPGCATCFNHPCLRPCSAGWRECSGYRHLLCVHTGVPGHRDLLDPAAFALCETSRYATNRSRQYAADSSTSSHRRGRTTDRVWAPPTASVGATDVKTLIPEAYLEPAALAIAMGTEPAATIEPLGTSSKGAHFTTYRAFPDALTSAYPNSTVGKLFFPDPQTGANSVCSASVLRHRVVVTAGHCVAKPSLTASQRYFFTNFMFVPSYRNGVATYGTWTPRAVWVTNAWYTSDGSFPNTQDVAMMVMNDDRSGRRIGAVTGILGWHQRFQLAKNHVTMIGYPGNLDNGQRMQINHAFTFGDGGNNTFLYGSGMREDRAVDHGSSIMASRPRAIR